MKNLFRILLIITYFTLCLLFKDNFENCLAKNYELSYRSSHFKIEQINFQDNSRIFQTQSQEITNIQNNNRGNNSLNVFKNYNLISNCYTFNSFLKHYSNRRILALNLEYIVYTRAP